MEMILTGIENKNEYYTNHYFTSIFQDNAEDTIKKWKQKEKQEEIQLPWKKLRDVRTQYYNIRDRYLRSKNEEASKPMIQELATLYLKALGYESINSVSEEVADGLNVPIFHEVTKANGEISHCSGSSLYERFRPLRATGGACSRQGERR